MGEYARLLSAAQEHERRGRRYAAGRARIEQQRAGVTEYAKRAAGTGLRGLAYILQPAISAAEVGEQAGRALVAAATQRPKEKPGDVAMYGKRAARALANVPLSIPFLRELPGIKQLERRTRLQPQEMTIGGEAMEDLFDAIGVGEGPRFKVPFLDVRLPSVRRMVSFGIGFYYNPMTYMHVAGKTAKGFAAAKELGPGVTGLAPTLAGQASLGQTALLTWGRGEARRALIRGQTVFNIAGRLGDKFRHTGWGRKILDALSTTPIPPERWEQGWLARMTSEHLGADVTAKMRPWTNKLTSLKLDWADDWNAYRLAEKIRVGAGGAIEAVPAHVKAVAAAPPKVLEAAGHYRRALDVVMPAMKAAGFDLPDHLAGAWHLVKEYATEGAYTRGRIGETLTEANRGLARLRNRAVQALDEAATLTKEHHRKAYLQRVGINVEKLPELADDIGSVKAVRKAYDEMVFQFSGAALTNKRLMRPALQYLKDAQKALAKAAHRAGRQAKLADAFETAATKQIQNIYDKGISYVPRQAQPRVAKLLQLEAMPPADYIQETTREVSRMARNRGQGERLARWWQSVAAGERVHAERTRAYLHRTWLDNDLLPMTIDQVDDIVQRAATGHLKLVKKAAVPGFIERMMEKYLGYTANRSFYLDSPAGVMGSYHRSIMRAARGQAFIKAMRGVGGREFVEGMIPGEALSANLKGLFFKADDALEITRAAKRMVVPEFVSNTWRAMQYVTRKWIPFVTGIRPAFHVRNWYSNKWLNALSGVYDVRDYDRAYRAYWKKIHNIGLPVEEARWLNEATNTGCLGKFAGVVGEFQKRPASRFKGRIAQALESADPLSDRWFAAYWGRGFGAHIENMDRLVHYFAKRRQGYSAWAAAFSVKKTLFDYGELTTFERRYMKTLVPFWSWLKNNIRFQTEMILDKPMMQTFLVRATAPGTAAVPADEAAAIPVYQREGLALRLGRNGDIATYLRGIGLPIEDIGRILTFERKGLQNLEKLLGNMNPIIQQVYEHVSGRSAFFGDQLQPTVHGAFQWLQYAPQSVRTALGFRVIQLGGGRKMYRMNPHALSLMRTMGAAAEASHAFDERYPPAQRVARLLTGFRVAHLDVPRELHRNWTRDMKAMLDELEKRGEVRMGTYWYGARTPENERALAQQKLMRR